jgi:hypothetical protein
MSVYWYGGNSNLFVPQDYSSKEELNRDKQRENLLAENEK